MFWVLVLPDTMSGMTQLNFSTYARYLPLKLAHILVDLVRGDEIRSAHLAEALQYDAKINFGIANP
jgi:predicted ATPase with chaperone activity